MTLLLKLCLMVVSLVGAGSAIGVPLIMKAGKDQRSNFEAISEGGGIVQALVEIKKCTESDNGGWSSVDFGSKEDREICWILQPEEQTSLTKENEFTDLLRNNWDKGAGTWSNNSKQSNSWKTVCGSAPSWIITTEANSTAEYLGTCEWETGKTELFVKKQIEELDSDNKKRVTLFICQGECLTEQTSGNIKQLESPEKGNWLPVTFKSKKTSRI